MTNSNRHLVAQNAQFALPFRSAIGENCANSADLKFSSWSQ